MNLSLLARISWIANGLVALLVTGMLLISCSETKPQAGTAQAVAVDAAARSNSNHLAADQAGIKAAAAKALADGLEAAAKSNPTEARINAAVDARVASAVASGIHAALLQQAIDADAVASQAAIAAATELAVEQATADERSWIYLCRLVGLGGLVVGVLLGGLVGYFAGVRLGILLGGLISLCGFLVVGYGSTVTWLPTVLLLSVLAGLAVLALEHYRSLRFGVAASRTIDLIEGTAHGVLSDAKVALGKAKEASAGLKAKISKQRSKWRTKATAAAGVAA